MAEEDWNERWGWIGPPNPVPAEPDWRAVADVLAAELRKWGWGDMHYPSDGRQEKPVRDALAVYERALRGPQPGRQP